MLIDEDKQYLDDLLNADYSKYVERSNYGDQTFDYEKGELFSCEATLDPTLLERYSHESASLFNNNSNGDWKITDNISEKQLYHVLWRIGASQSDRINFIKFDENEEKVKRITILALRNCTINGMNYQFKGDITVVESSTSTFERVEKQLSHNTALVRLSNDCQFNEIREAIKTAPKCQN
jgi:hypothetical protein